MAKLVIDITTDTSGAKAGIRYIIARLKTLGEKADACGKRVEAVGTSFVTAAKTANKGADDFEKGLGKVFKAIGGLDGKGIQQAENAATSFSKMAQALAKIGDIKPQSITAAKNSLAKLVPVAKDLASASAGIEGFAAALQAIPEGFKAFTVGKAPDGAKLTKKGTQLLKPKIDVESIEKVAAPLSNVASSLGRMSDEHIVTAISNTSDAIGELGSALNGLGASASKVNDLASGLRRLPEALQGFTRGGQARDFTAQINAVQTALQQFSAAITKDVLPPDLANSIYKLGDGLKSLSKAGADSSTAANLTASAAALKQFAEAFAGMETANLSSVGESVKAVASAIEKIGSIQTGKTFSNKLTATADSVRAFVDSLSGVDIGKLPAVGTAIRDIANAVARLGRVASDNIGKGLSAAAKSLKSFADSLSGLDLTKLPGVGEAMRNLANAISRLNIVAGNGSLSANLATASAAMQSFVSSLTSIPDSAIAKLERLGAAAAQITSSMYGAGQAARSAASAVKAVGKEAASAGSNAGKAAKGGFTKLLEAFARVARYRILRSILQAIANAFKEGLDNAYEWAKANGDSLAPTLDNLANAAKQLRNQMGAAFGELLQILAPVIIKIIELLTMLFTAITKVIAAIGTLFGGDGKYLVAGEVTEGWKDATKAAKDYERTVLAFDELNKLNEKKGGDTAPFKQGDVGDAFGDLEFHDMPWITKLKDDIGGATGLLDLLAETILDLPPIIITVEDEELQWEPGKVTDLIRTLDELAARSPVTVTARVKDEVTEPVLGAKGALDGLVAAAPYMLTLGLVAGPVMLGIEAIKLAIAELTSQPAVVSLVQQGAESVVTAFESVKEKVDGLVANAPYVIQLALEGAPAIVTAIAAVKTAIETLEPASKKARETLSGFAETTSAKFNAFKEKASTAFDAVKEKIKTLKGAGENALQNFTAFVDGSIKASEEFLKGVGKSIGTAAAFIATSVYEGLKSAADNVVSFVNGAASALHSWAAGTLQNFASWASGVVQSIGNALKTAWENFKSFMSATGQKVGSWFSENKNIIIPVTIGAAVVVGAIALAPVTGGASLGAIALAANGGTFPNDGSLILAGEAGPEIVANVGSHTGVMNVEQMESAVAAGNEGVINVLYSILDAVQSGSVLNVTIGDDQFESAWERAQRNELLRAGR